MNQDPSQHVASILKEFDDRADAFYFYEVSARVNPIVAQERDSGQTLATDVIAEQIVFELVPDYRKDHAWGTYYGPVMEFGGTTVPDIRLMNDAVLEHWVARARQTKHPLLRIRYADAAWDFAQALKSWTCPHDVPRLMIDATVDLVARNLMPHQVDGIRFLRRAMFAAIRLRDDSCIERVRDAVIAYEDLIAVDHFPGIWGFSFDILIAENNKVPLRPDQREKLIADLEGRLSRLADIKPEKMEPQHLEFAAMRLAQYYRRREQNEDVRRVLVLYANACIRKSQDDKNWLPAAGWLETVHQTLISFGLNAEAKALQPHYREAAQAMREKMIPMEVNMPIDRDQFEQYIAGFLEGDDDEILGRLAGHYILRRDIEMKRLEDIMEGRTILSLFSSTLVDQTGRAVSVIGPIESDPEGNLIRHMATMVDYGSLFLRAVIDRLATTQKISRDNVLKFVIKSALFTPDREPILAQALDAYLSGNWLVGIHLLVPQLEHAVRTFIETIGGASIKTKMKNGGLLLRNLDELLLDEHFVRVFGVNVAFYLRVLLTEQRGCNIRNDVAHGIMPPHMFNPRTADRLFHALLVIGCVRPQSNDMPQE
jgi:hypothetical protein